MLSPGRLEARMPSHVVWFERLMYLSVVIGAVVSLPLFLDFAELDDTELDAILWTVVIAALIVFVLAIFTLLTWLTARRRKNWARWLLGGLIVVLTILAFYDDVSAGEFFRNGPVLSTLDILSSLIELW